MKKDELLSKGLTEEQIQFVMAENGKDIQREKEKISAMEAERDNYKEQLATAQEALKGFEGIDVNELNEKIKDLARQLTDKDNEYRAKLADMEFDSFITEAIKKSGAKSDKAVKAFLDLESLKASKNRDSDLNAAIEAVKKENDYLFTTEDTSKPTFVKPATGSPTGGGMDKIRAAMGLPVSEK